MNLHVTIDRYGLFPLHIAKRIKDSERATENLMVNLTQASEFRDDMITYIDSSTEAYKKYIDGLVNIEKAIFHPCHPLSFNFLKLLLKRFPKVQVYWVFWSYELYNLQHLVHNLYEPFSSKYVRSKILPYSRSKETLKKIIIFFLSFTRLKKTYNQTLKNAYSRVHYFCSFLPSDYSFLKSQAVNSKIQYLPFAYLSLEQIMPELNSFRSTGNKIMIGHSSYPDGNHFEVLEKLTEINPGLSFFLPLAYGNKEYGGLIKNEALKRFKDIEILEEKLDSISYYKKLTEVGCAIINVKVQQGLGNIMGLIWMGAKVFLNENTSTYQDFSTWGIKIFSIQKDLNKEELSQKLSVKDVENNRRIIYEKLNEKTVSEYWKQILN